MASVENLDRLCVNTIRFLAVDGVQQANSGHPGLPMGAASMAYVLWTKFLRHNPADPRWPDRDRFVLSGGHGSMLLYSLLHLTGYDLSLDDLKHFRQWGSKTPGHPEYGLTPGVELTTGPLGQGFAMGVGLALAEAHLAARYNRPDHDLINHTTYGIVSDGDLMEGISHEAASLAGHWQLGKLIYLYDDNHITLAGTTNLSYTEDVTQRFEAYGWQVLRVEDGNDLAALEAALSAARSDTLHPTLIRVHTIIGFGAPHKQNTFEAHGSPLGPAEVKAAKENLGWPVEPPFHIPGEALDHFREALKQGQAQQTAWEAKFDAYEAAYPELAAELARALKGELPEDWNKSLPEFPAGKGQATRVSSGQVLNALAAKLPSLIGGSADLNPSTNTALKGLGDLQNPVRPSAEVQGAVGEEWSYAGRNIAYGVREHAMGSLSNGLALHGGVIPFTATFLQFADYMRPAIRLAALMEQRVIFVFTHDSIFLGEDGPTHQPVEHLAALRAIPQLVVVRSADATETAVAWQMAIERQHGPTVLIFSRQALPTFDRAVMAPADQTRRGGYVLIDSDGTPEIILIATGSEVSLAVNARVELAKQNIQARVVSLPSWEIFNEQEQSYQDAVLPPTITKRLAIEAGVKLGWQQYAAEVLSLDRFGASAPAGVLAEKFGFTVENVVRIAQRIVNG